MRRTNSYIRDLTSVRGDDDRDGKHDDDGEDIFVFAEEHTLYADDGADVITDFESGVDKLDVSALSDVGVLFIGDAQFQSFSAFLNAGWSLVRADTFNALSSVQATVDGGTDVDWSVALTGGATITGDDFIL